MVKPGHFLGLSLFAVAATVSLATAAPKRKAKPVAPAPPATAPAPPALPAAQPFISACKGVELVLSKVRQDGSIVAFELQLHNSSKVAVALMRSGDGSSSQRRNPSLSFAVQPNNVTEPGECGMMNAMAEEDFVTLQPGQSVKLAWGHANTPNKSGKYTLQATYRNDPASQQMSGDPLFPRIAKTVPCEVTSAAVSFDWKMSKVR
ncbi:MAG TPA: hypothetical protein PLF40_31700 [Kofleriaceae bacterium]|nr:hypothetical protein [Kofleriaceae bacterium]